MKWAWQQECSSAAEKLVLVALADNADNDGYCWPGNAKTSERCQMSEASVRRHLKRLDESGLIAKVKRRRRKDGTLSVWIYRLDVYDQRPTTTAHPLPVDIHAQKTAHERTKVCAPVSAQEPSGESTGNPHFLLRSDEVLDEIAEVEEIHAQHSDELALIAESVIDAEVVDQSEIDFDRWYQQYPRKKARQDAERAWKKLKPDQRRLAMETLPDHIDYWDSENTEKDFIPYPATWLNGNRWEDELTPSEPKGKPNQLLDHIQRRINEHHDGLRAHGLLGSGDSRLR